MKKRGTAVEREIREKLYSKGIISFRVAGSGSTRKIPSLDLVAVYKNKVVGIEVKYLRKSKKLYLRKEQMEELREISKHIPVYIAVKIFQKGVYFVEFSNDVNGLSVDEIIVRGIPLDSFVEILKTKSLTLV